MNYLLLTLLELFFRHCDYEASGTKTINLLSKPDGRISNLSEFAYDIDYLPLQTTENSLLKRISDIRSDDDRVYIRSHTGIFCFSKKGNFLFKLENPGRGPEEMTYLYGFDVDPVSNLLLKYGDRNKLFLYKINGSGYTFLKSMVFEDLNTANFVYGRDEILISYFSPFGNEPYRNALFNLRKDTLGIRPNYYKYIKVNKMIFGLSYGSLCFRFNFSTYFKEVFCDTVFTIDQQNRFKPWLILYSHGKHPKPEDFVNISPEIVRAALSVTNLMEVEKYMIFRIMYEAKVFLFIYDKTTEKVYHLNNTTTLIDDIAGGGNFEPLFCSEGKLYSWIEALNFKKYVASDLFIKSVVKNPDKKIGLEKLANSLEVTDNPVLIVVTPKK